MIRRFTAANFKSIKHLDLPMRSFSVLVGPNGAGKTNIVNALELFGELINRGTVDPIREQGYDQLIRRERRPARGGLQFSVNVDLPNATKERVDLFGPNDIAPPESVRLEASLTITGSVATGDVKVESEGLILRSTQGVLDLCVEGDALTVKPGADPALSLLFAGWLRPRLGRAAERERSRQPSLPAEPALLSSMEPYFTRPDPELRALRLLSWQRIPMLWMRQFRDAVRVTRVRLDASALRRDSSFEDSSREHLIGSSGEGLAAAVHRLRGDAEKPKSAFAAILEALQDVYPRIEDVKADRIQTGRLILAFKERGIPQALDTRSVSDGVLHALALLLALEGGLGGAGLLAIEEPENAIHPWSLRSMMKRAQSMPTRQLLFTTHSETVVNAVEDIDSLLVVENDDREGTVVELASKRESALRTILRESEQKLGNVWMGGTLGGVPRSDS